MTLPQGMFGICSLLERESCSLTSIPFSIQPDQIVQHAIEVAEGLQHPTENRRCEDEASCYPASVSFPGAP